MGWTIPKWWDLLGCQGWRWLVWSLYGWLRWHTMAFMMMGSVIVGWLWCDGFLDLWIIGVRILTTCHYRWILRQLWNNESSICGTNWKKVDIQHMWFVEDIPATYYCNQQGDWPTNWGTAWVYYQAKRVSPRSPLLGSLNLGLFPRVWTWQPGTWQGIPLHPVVYGIFLNICHLMGIITMENHNV